MLFTLGITNLVPFLKAQPCGECSSTYYKTATFFINYDSKMTENRVCKESANSELKKQTEQACD